MKKIKMGLFKKGIKRKLWIPLQKTKDGDFRGILSDTSIDRDGEMMSRSLLKNWALNKTIPTLIDHDNKMKSWVGGWSDLKVISRNNHSALTGKYDFFSKEANPEAQRIKTQIEEAVKKGMQPGISIGAVPKAYKEVDIDGKSYKKWTKAELVEASFVPIQSNRNSYTYVAKSFGLNNQAVNEEVIQKMAEEEQEKDSVEEDTQEEETEEETSETEEDKEEDKDDEEEDDEADGDKSSKTQKLEKKFMTKDMVVDLVGKQFKKETKKLKEEITKEVTTDLMKQIIVKKGFTDPMIIDKDLETGEAEPTIENMARAMTGVKLQKTKPKPGDN